MERLQGAWEAVEGEKGALAVEVAELKSALAAAQLEREGMEGILQQTEQELNEVGVPPLRPARTLVVPGTVCPGTYTKQYTGLGKGAQCCGS